MKCTVAEDLLPLYLEGLCREETAKELEAHLEHCPQCRRKAEALKKEYRVKEERKPSGEYLKEGRLFEKRERALREEMVDAVLGWGVFVDAILLYACTAVIFWQIGTVLAEYGIQQLQNLQIEIPCIMAGGALMDTVYLAGRYLLKKEMQTFRTAFILFLGVQVILIIALMITAIVWMASAPAPDILRVFC